jgi:GNAT superfamily N-acetyltransferase
MRRVRVDEVDELRRVRLAMLLDTPDAFASRHADEAAQPDEFWQERAVIAAQSSQVATFHVVDGDRHVGSATGLRLDPARAADLVAMWVDPEWRRRGIGQRLVDGVCRWAARQGSASSAGAEQGRR